MLADRLCYWLDSSEENYPGFAKSDVLWLRLLPLAVEQVNSTKQTKGEPEKNDGESITSAALNSPFGRLLNHYLRDCPTGPHETWPSLPQPQTIQLQGLTGRAREIVANRMVLSLDYFRLVDPAWLQEFVITPMQENGGIGRRLWDAFALYAEIPRPVVWSQLQATLFAKLSPSLISPGAQRRLAEMAVVVWTSSKTPKSDYVIDTARFRGALSSATDEVRSAAAWQFAIMFRRDRSEGADHKQDYWALIGGAFFDEVWPREPALQTASTANDFARIPAMTGLTHFAKAVRTVLPYLRPFELWDVETGLGLDEKTAHLVRKYPEDTLELVDACIRDDWGQVEGLGELLTVIQDVAPSLTRDPRLRHLKRFAGSI